MDIKVRPQAKRILLASALVFMATFTFRPVSAQGAKEPQSTKEQAECWDRKAEDAFGLSKGLGRLLLLREEWEEHERRMQAMAPKELEEYRNEIHRSLMRRARLQGVHVPGAEKKPAEKKK